MVFYNSWLAKKLLADGYGAIMLFGMIFTEIKKEYSNSDKAKTTLAHEKVHIQQYIDCSSIAFFISLVILFTTGWWPSFCFIPVFYYFLYGIEFIIRYVYAWFKFRHLPVRLMDYACSMISFEQYAYDLEKEWKLPCSVQRPVVSFGWLKFMTYF